MSDFKDTSYAIKRSISCVQKRMCDNDVYYDGYVLTPDGIVDVLAEASSRHPYTILRLAHGGRLYRREYNRFYTPRGIVTLARRFAREVTQKKAGKS